MSKITTGYYQPTFQARYDSTQRQWYVDNKPVSSVCLAEYPCYTLNDDYSELGSHCIVLGDELFTHKLESEANSKIVFDEKINGASPNAAAKAVIATLSNMYFIQADNSVYFAFYRDDTARVVPFDINAYQLNLYAKEIQVYSDLTDPTGVCKTTIVILTKDQDTRFITTLFDKDTITATTLLKTGTLTQRTPAVDDGFEDSDQSEAILARNGNTVAIREATTDINSLKSLVRNALDRLPDKGIVGNNKAPFNVDIIKPIGYHDVETAVTDAITVCKGHSKGGSFVTSYIGNHLHFYFDNPSSHKYRQVLELISIIAAAQCVTDKITPETIVKLLNRLFRTEEGSDGVIGIDFIFPDAVQFYLEHNYMLKNLNSDKIDGIISCDFTDSAYAIIAKELGSTYTLPSVKNFLRKPSVFKQGRSELPTWIPFGLSKYEANAAKMMFAHAGLLPDYQLPTYMKYKALDLMLQGPYAFAYLCAVNGASLTDGHRWEDIVLAGVDATKDITPEMVKILAEQDGVPYTKSADFSYRAISDRDNYPYSSNQIDSDIGSASRNSSITGLRYAIQTPSANIAKVKSSSCYPYSLWTDDYRCSDTIDWLLMLSGLSGVAASLKHSYRSVRAIPPEADNELYTQGTSQLIYGLLSFITVWQRLTLGTLASNPDSACQFSFNNQYEEDKKMSLQPCMGIHSGQLKHLAYGWVNVKNDVGYDEHKLAMPALYYRDVYATADEDTSAKGKFFYINPDVTNNPEAHRNALALEHFDYTGLPVAKVVSMLLVEARDIDKTGTDWYKVKHNDTQVDIDTAKTLIKKLSIYPDAIVSPAYSQPGAKIATLDDLYDKMRAQCPEEARLCLEEIISGKMNKQPFTHYIQQSQRELRNFFVRPFACLYYAPNSDLHNFCLGEFGVLASAFSNYGATNPKPLNSFLYGYIHTTYANSLYINEHINAAVVLSDNNKDTAFYKQYARALKLFTTKVSEVLRKVNTMEELTVALQTMVGYFQTNLQSYTYDSLVALLEATPSIQEALVQHTDRLLASNPDMVATLNRHKGVLSGLSDSIVEEENLDAVMESHMHGTFFSNTIADGVIQNIDKATAQYNSNAGIKDLQPRFTTLRDMTTIFEQMTEEPQVDILSQALGEAIPEVQGFAEEPDDEPLDDISVLDDLLGTAVSQNIPAEEQAVTEPEPEPEVVPANITDDGFDDEALAEDEELDDLDDYDFLSTGTMEPEATEPEAEVQSISEPEPAKMARDTLISENEPAIALDPLESAIAEQNSEPVTTAPVINAPIVTNPLDEAVAEQNSTPITNSPLIINAPIVDNPLDDAIAEQSNEPVVNAPTASVAPLITNAPAEPVVTEAPEQEGVVLNLDNPAFGAQIEQEAPAVATPTPSITPTVPMMNTSAFTQTPTQVIPPVAKPTLVINTPSAPTPTQPVVNAPVINTPAQPVINAPVQPVINTPQTAQPVVNTPATPAPVVVNTPQITPTAPTVQAGAISTQQAKFNKPIKTANTVVINAPNATVAKPASTDQILYSGTDVAPVITEALRKGINIARVALVITPEKAGYARTVKIEPTVQALVTYCDENNAICYMTNTNEIYLIQGNAKMYVALLHKKNSDMVLRAIKSNRFSLEKYPLIKLLLTHLI